MNFDILINSIGGHVSLLQEAEENDYFWQMRTISQVPDECWLLSNCHKSYTLA